MLSGYVRVLLGFSGPRMVFKSHTGVTAQKGTGSRTLTSTLRSLLSKVMKEYFRPKLWKLEGSHTIVLEAGGDF